MSGKLWQLALVIAFSSALAERVEAQSYVVHDLGTLGGSKSNAYDINELGQVVGYAKNSLEINRSFLLTPSGATWWIDADLDGANDLMLDLGTLDPLDPPSKFGLAWGMNELAQVCGTCQDASGARRAFLWDAIGGMIDLGDLGFSFAHTGQAVNDLGEVVGNSQVTSQIFHGFYWEPSGGIVDLGTLPGFSSSSVVDIDSSGQIVGYVFASPTLNEAVLWQSPSTSPLLLGTLGGTTSTGHAINESQTIVGWASDLAGARHPFRIVPVAGTYNQDLDMDGVNDLMDDLGLLDPGDVFVEARDINASGLIVGYSSTTALPNISGARAFLYNGSGALIDLNTRILPGSGFTLSVAYAINDAGQIVGSGYVGGEEHGFLLERLTFPALLPEATEPTILEPARR